MSARKPTGDLVKNKSNPPDDVEPWEPPYFRVPARIAKLRRCNGVALDAAAILVLAKLYSNVRRARGFELNQAQRLAEDLPISVATTYRALGRLEDARLISRRLRLRPKSAPKNPGGYDATEVVLIDGALIADDAELESLTTDAIARRGAWCRECESAASVRQTMLPKKRDRDEVPWPTADDAPDEPDLGTDLSNWEIVATSQDETTPISHSRRSASEALSQSERNVLSIAISRNERTTKKRAETRSKEFRMLIGDDVRSSKDDDANVQKVSAQNSSILTLDDAIAIMQACEGDEGDEGDENE